MEVKNFKSKSELVQKTADFIVQRLKKVLNQDNEAHIAVSGGSTPVALFEYLSSECIDSLNWEKVNIWWVDERFVGHDDTENNFHNAMQAGLSKLPAHFHRLDTENLSIDQSVQLYKDKLRKIKVDTHFHIVLLGAGTDGHTASLFENDMHLINSEEEVRHTINPHTKQERISLNFNQLISAGQTVLILSGENKKTIFKQLNKNQNLPVNWVMQNAKNAMVYTDF